MVSRQCQNCKKQFSIFPSRAKNGNGIFCSLVCARKGKPSRYWLGKNNPYLSKYRKENPAWNSGGTHLAIRGEKHWNWKGGITGAHKAIRASVSYKRWRSAVYERDNYTCVECGYRGNKLIADHIKSFSRYPELRLVIENGRTLCRECHKKTPNYCGKARNHD